MKKTSAQGKYCFQWLHEAAKRYNRAPLRVAVVHPVGPDALSATSDAARQGLIVPLLIGPRARILSAAEVAGISVSEFEIVDTPHSHASASSAISLVRDGRADAIMKGDLHTGELMSEVVRKSSGLRTERRMSHVFILSTDFYGKPLLISDGAVNILPDLSAKRWITQNAIDAARAIGIAQPKVAILSATEEVDPGIVSTVEAAALSKMADRGQIIGGLVDGPMALDLAVSPESVRRKGLVSAVAGDADILIVPGLEAGNMLAKQIDYLSAGAAAGLVVGARVPIILTSRSDTPEERVASCAFAQAFTGWLEAQ